jgi:hypothetical protein
MTRSASSIGDPPDVSRARGKAVVAGGIGNFVEWYDFALYGYSRPQSRPCSSPAAIPQRRC